MGNKKISLKVVEEDYLGFDDINGKHPLQERIPDSHIAYSARTRKGGKVVYFNFELAREMGLISKGHPDKLNRKLEKKILDTFALVIINEYDIENNIEFDKRTVKPYKYMATKYLQLQHDNKKGETSGDGRSIWNGFFKGKGGKIWDVSSCGTGATKLSPATSKFGRYFQTGDPSISYGCGYAETLDGLASAIMSEIYARNDIPTERCLGIIEFEKGISINIRAGMNLLRPSHIFNHLKQNNYQSVKAAVDYYIERQVKNKEWKEDDFGRNKYKFFLENMIENFAKIAARFESDYIFCWLDWDGDNILMDGGIIDYGSIRQFGLYHFEYRYDDVERWSTNLAEQKGKAKYIIQTFAQLVDFIIKKDKGNLKDYAQHNACKLFDKKFEFYKQKFLLEKVGFTDKTIELLLAKEKSLVESFYKVFFYFEKQNSDRGVRKVSDGVTRDAIFCMRDILRTLPEKYLVESKPISNEEFLDIIKSSYARPSDYNQNSHLERQIKVFQNHYFQLIKKASLHTQKGERGLLREVYKRSQVINRYEKMTGDGVLQICNTLFKKMKDLNSTELYNSIENIIIDQTLNFTKKEAEKKKLGEKGQKLEKTLLKIVHDYSEGI